MCVLSAIPRPFVSRLTCSEAICFRRSLDSALQVLLCVCACLRVPVSPLAPQREEGRRARAERCSCFSATFGPLLPLAAAVVILLPPAPLG